MQEVSSLMRLTDLLRPSPLHPILLEIRVSVCESGGDPDLRSVCTDLSNQHDEEPFHHPRKSSPRFPALNPGGKALVRCPLVLLRREQKIWGNTRQTAPG